MNTVIIGIGSNIAPEKNIPLAMEFLKEKVSIEKISALARTLPIGIADQPDFINGAVKISTHLSKEELQLFLKMVEDRTGRDRSQPRYGPRTIDLDIVIWNGEIIDPDYYSREFLQAAIAEIFD
ncbi:MAG TPA: 2-amino-4-hydroxy-6-hydroxymethyldihydropteridine diphosphokinase [Prolixibacteraceae bacterium]|nr:2-amino-4-hydroxy-6-hydroxymethyldihydropteridine diphosphokinase [Prolixibacteraceae bacterium]